MSRELLDYLTYAVRETRRLEIEHLEHDPGIAWRQQLDAARAAERQGRIQAGIRTATGLHPTSPRSRGRS